MDALPEELSQSTEKIIGCAFKVARSFDNTHTMQYLNYLRASGLAVCLLINFGRLKIEIKRIFPSDVWKSAVYGHI